MRAVVVHGPGDVRVEERPDPSPGPGDVLVAMEWGGVCGSDISYALHGASGTAVLRHPLVLGHEVAGRVAVLGEGVTSYAVGDAVTVHPATPSDEPLPARLMGRTNLHREVRYLGSAAFDPHVDGGFSTYKVFRASQLRALPSGVSTQLGALAEPLAVALHAVGRLGPLDDREVLVNGAGSIGCLVVAAAKARGAGRVVAADVNAAALDQARSLGADDVVDLGADQTLPSDVELVVEASGVPAALGAVLHATSRGGTVVQVGNLPIVPTPAVLADLVTREITWTGSYRFVDEITEAVELLAKGIDLSPLIAGTVDLDDAPAAIPAAGSTPGKVLLRLG
ncbi:L-idonate 5-dehydrogenase [Kribbella pittospori]|uniref:L-idonate 5-dehydrogenase n=1 Tax=Kribbella pittospori TaxID=722689 RepID=A0A4R0K9S7_9ACTN|nr:zinc-binding dehydrogenase [Kribbella pittospori]TCC56991.1 L-idonate 5-dehydrogenase [Kribbella pittospori]